MPKKNLMSDAEAKELQNAIDDIGLQDVRLGRVLHLFAAHLAHLNSLDYPVQQAPAEAEAPVEQAPAEQAPEAPAEAPAQEGV